MCIEDIKIGRREEAGQITVSATNAGVLWVAQDLKRTCLILCPPSGGADAVFASIENQGQVGYPLFSGCVPLVLNVKDHGQLVTRAWYATSSGAAHNVTALFSSLPGE